MSKRYRIFEAPSSESNELPIDKSPWHFERDARIPLGHWELIIEFAKSVDPEKGDLLEKYSVGPFENNGYLDISDDNLSKVIKFMIELKSTQNISASLTTFKDKIFNDIEEEYENDEYQRMLEAVVTVYRESQRLGAPVCAYND